jgi:hypothetical protein
MPQGLSTAALGRIYSARKADFAAKRRSARMRAKPAKEPALRVQQKAGSSFYSDKRFFSV